MQVKLKEILQRCRRLEFDEVKQVKRVWRKECHVFKYCNFIKLCSYFKRAFCFQVSTAFALTAFYILIRYVWLNVIIHLSTCDDSTCPSALINKSFLHCCFRSTSPVIRGQDLGEGWSHGALYGGLTLEAKRAGRWHSTFNNYFIQKCWDFIRTVNGLIRPNFVAWTTVQPIMNAEIIIHGEE